MSITVKDIASRIEKEMSYLPLGTQPSRLQINRIVESTHVVELAEALEKALHRSCGCYSNETDDWHANDCAVPDMRKALALVKGEKS